VEAERANEDLESTRDRLIRAGLDAYEASRRVAADGERLSIDVLLVTATPTEHQELRAEALAQMISPL
jgi:hypothetical protein